MQKKKKSRAARMLKAAAKGAMMLTPMGAQMMKNARKKKY